MTRTTWTIAYRKRTANRFLRVASWSGTWAQADALAAVFVEANPTLDVFCVPTAASEVNGAAEDAGNILVDSGRRVRIVESAEVLPAAMLVRIPAADVANARWTAGRTIADLEMTEDDAHAEAEALLAVIAIDGRPDDVTKLLVEAEAVTDCFDHLLMVRRIAGLTPTH
jgi:hypothetical protein